MGDEAELNRNKAWRREKGEGAEIDLTFPGGPRRRERARQRERDWGRERERRARECGRPMQGRWALALIPSPTPLPRLR